ncbi:tRNA (adenosine(37)-N6)-threonylcarbamoyltransferase complex ATPase subunit type 1 TsaE [Listeria sp. PSOL-1]|uniref:tRNA (adenosine(37)-N6)-threonylcarbamoyltransferase complex ATPase subunit type 1 TsaE n=1 Tax=Listeria sp. PSOL-1 TaxID=1844999 RepID=UPI0013CFC2CF|nr:tRNA (adenosine(37)-N6)-threonylcarbamoyltransferase complex ATPase subunit type 1 TsaE [Listeria sp. PSOL-1]
MKFEQQVKSAEETHRIAKKLGEHLHAGDVILLEGNLGAGKTTFTKGIAEGLAITELIKSPTFTIIREYKSGRLLLYHMDVYRLEEGGAFDLGFEEYFEGMGVCVVEWAQFIAEVLPDEFLKITINHVEGDARDLVVETVGARYEQLGMEVFKK